MAQISRVARDKSAVIMKSGDTYHRVSADLSQIDKAGTLEELTSTGSWRRPVPADNVRFEQHVALASGEVVVDTPAPERQIRVPKSIQRTLLENASNLASNPSDLARINQIATSTTTTASQVVWLKDWVENARYTYSSVGGDAAYTWFSKLEKSGTLTAAGEPFTPSDDLEYFGISEVEGDTKVSGLIAVNREDDIVLTWTPEGFVPAPETVSEYEAPGIIEIDPDTAASIAAWVNEGGSPTEGFDIQSAVVGEDSLFEMALAEGDEWLNVEYASALIADAADYTPAERSVNAQRQQRQGGGRFGGPQIDEQQENLTGFAKARLPMGLELLVDPAGRIAEYLEISGATAAPETAPVAAPEEDAPIVAAVSPDDPSVTPLYLAIVDPVDQTAVLDVAAILPDESGNATAWTRTGGSWQPNNTIVADLQGATPPPVVELTDEPTIKDVLSQVDAFDSSAPAPEDRADAPVTVTAACALFGDYGEILPAGVLIAAGIPGVSDTPGDKAATERLMRYWTVGPGGAKIRWGTKGDLTRAHRYLAKYVGPKRAWGLAQNLHKRMFGVPNKTRDKAMGH